MTRIAIFASGNGSNFEALTKALQFWRADVTVAVLIYDRRHALVRHRSDQLEVPSVYINFTTYPNKAAAEATILAILQQYKVDTILLAGYMRIVGPTLLAPFVGRILNIHPALLPAFPGAHGIEDAYKAGAVQTGVTIHWVDQGVDSGPIVAQATVPIYPKESLMTLENRIHETEHALYPQVVKQLIEQGRL